MVEDGIFLQLQDAEIKVGTCNHIIFEFVCNCMSNHGLHRLRNRVFTIYGQIILL